MLLSKGRIYEEGMHQMQEQEGANKHEIAHVQKLSNLHS